MKNCVNLHAGLFAAAVLVAGCGPNLTAVPPGPATGPTTLAPLLLPQLDGVWGGEMQLTGVAGGTGPSQDAGIHACGGGAFVSVFGESNFSSLSIKQDGRELEARLASAETGLACTYTGVVGTGGLVTLASDSCTNALVLRCPNGNVVALEFRGSTITAQTDAPVEVTSLSNGRVAFTYNITSVGPPSPLNDQGLVAHHSFSALTRR